MTTNLIPLKGGVNRLSLHDVSLLRIDEVGAWLYALDFSPSERRKACLQIVSDGYFSVCNIEHRLEFVVSAFE